MLFEDFFNPDHDLWLSEDAIESLFYEDPTEHRFNQVIPRPGGVIALRRTVEALRDIDGEGSRPLSDLAGRRLYLILVAGDEQGAIEAMIEEPQIERRRELLAISFR
jgi:hypothetical protein